MQKRYIEWKSFNGDVCIGHNKKNLKRNPNYEIEENENPNPKDTLLWNRRKLQAIIAYLSTTLESMKNIVEMS